MYTKKGYVHPLGADETGFVPKPRNRKRKVKWGEKPHHLSNLKVFGEMYPYECFTSAGQTSFLQTPLTRAARNLWSSTGIPILAETVVLLLTFSGARLYRKSLIAAWMERKDSRLVYRFNRHIEFTGRGKKGTEKWGENIFSSLLLLWAFLLDWGQDSVLWLWERLMKGNLGNDCFQKLHGKLV